MIDIQEEKECKIEWENRYNYKSSFKEVLKNPIACNNKRFEILKEDLKDYSYWIFENTDGRFIFTDKSIFFQSLLADKDFERFPFFQDYYFHFKEKFIDYAVIGFEDCIYMICLFENKKIKPLRIIGCLCGDISIDSYTKINDYHYTCGHALINNRPVTVVKPFRKNIEGYQLQTFKGHILTGLK